MNELALLEPGASDLTVQRAATGDEAAFARLVATYHAPMMRVAYAVTGEATSAAEAVQAAWAVAWRRLPGLRNPASVRAWLAAIAANEARQARRRDLGRVVDISSTIDAAAPRSDPADRIEVMDLAAALRTLSPDDRVLLALRFSAGLDSTEIAAQLGLSASGVRSRLSRLIQRLRTELDHA